MSEKFQQCKCHTIHRYLPAAIPPLLCFPSSSSLPLKISDEPELAASCHLAVALDLALQTAPADHDAVHLAHGHGGGRGQGHAEAVEGRGRGLPHVQDGGVVVRAERGRGRAVVGGSGKW